jgi:HEAT repeat protein
MQDGLLLNAVWAICGAVGVALVAQVAGAIVGRRMRPVTSQRTTKVWDAATRATEHILNGSDETRRRATSVLTSLLNDNNATEATIGAMAAVCRRLAGPDCEPSWGERIDRRLVSWIGDELNAEDSGVKCNALELAGSLRVVAARGLIVAATRSDEEAVRIAACRSLTAIDPDAALGVLLGFVERDGEWAAALLSHLLERLPGRGDAVLHRTANWSSTPALLTLAAEVSAAAPVLIEALSNNEDSTVLSAIEAILLRPSVPLEAAKSLRRHINSEQSAIRRGAATALGRLHDARSLMPLASLLGDADRSVRFAAAEALCQIPDGIGTLEAIAAGTDTGASEAARVALWAGTRDSTTVEHQTLRPKLEQIAT